MLLYIWNFWMIYCNFGLWGFILRFWNCLQQTIHYFIKFFSHITIVFIDYIVYICKMAFCTFSYSLQLLFICFSSIFVDFQAISYSVIGPIKMTERGEFCCSFWHDFVFTFTNFKAISSNAIGPYGFYHTRSFIFVFNFFFIFWHFHKCDYLLYIFSDFLWRSL